MRDAAEPMIELAPAIEAPKPKGDAALVALARRRAKKATYPSRRRRSAPPRLDEDFEGSPSPGARQRVGRHHGQIARSRPTFGMPTPRGEPSCALIAASVRFFAFNFFITLRT